MYFHRSANKMKELLFKQGDNKHDTSPNYQPWVLYYQLRNPTVIWFYLEWI